MDKCVYEPIYGQFPNCDGACKKGKDNLCPYYLVDKVWHIMQYWKKDAGVTTPVLWRWDNKRNKVCLYTTRPGYFIGLYGELYKRFLKLLCEADERITENGVDIIECDDGIGD